MTDSTAPAVRRTKADRPKSAVSDTVDQEATLHADLDLLCTVSTARPTTCCPPVGQRAPARQRSPRSSPSASPRCSWASPPTGASCVADKRLPPSLPRAAPPARASTSAAGAWSRRSSGCVGVLCRAVPGLLRRDRPARLDPRRVRALARDRAPLGAGRRLRLRLLPLATRAGSGACACTAPSPPTAPRAPVSLVAADRPEREVALALLPRALRGGEAIVCDKGYAGRGFARAVAALGACVAAPGAPRRARARAAPVVDPPAHRVGLQHLQGPAHARASRRAHAAQPPRAHRRAPARPRRRHLRQPCSGARAARSPPSWPNRAWHQSSSRRSV